MKKTTVDQIATKIPVVDLVPLCRRTQFDRCRTTYECRLWSTACPIFVEVIY